MVRSFSGNQLADSSAGVHWYSGWLSPTKKKPRYSRHVSLPDASNSSSNASSALPPPTAAAFPPMTTDRNPPLLTMLPIISKNPPKRTVRRNPSRPKMAGSIAEATALAPKKTVTRLSGSTSPNASCVSMAMGATE